MVYIGKTNDMVFSKTDLVNSTLLDGLRIQQFQSLKYYGITCNQTFRATRCVLGVVVSKSIRSAVTLSGKAAKRKQSFS